MSAKDGGEWSASLAGTPVVHFLEDARKGLFSLHRRAKSGCGAHPASYAMGTGCSFLGA